MRTWLEAYDSSGVKVAFIEATISGNTSTRLDEAGSFDVQCAVSTKVIDFLVRDAEVAIYTQEDTEVPVLRMRGRITKAVKQETGDSISIKISGRDLMEELRWQTVGLGLTFNAQTVQAIMSGLAARVPGWTAAVDAANQTRLQTARFDGSKVLKAVLKSAGQLGLHVRNGTTPRTLEIGAFGTAATTPLGEPIRAIKPPSSVTPELLANDAVLLIDSISMTEDGDALVNWAIPMGAGEGSAATTLANTTYRILNTDNTIYRAGIVPPYPIYRRVNAANIAEYYIDASAGGTQHQDTLSFKEIGPIANSTLAKQYASDALAVACMESLKRTRQANISFTLSVKKLRVDLRPGDMTHLTYKGVIATYNDPKSDRYELKYMDIDQDVWVMGVQCNISDSGLSYTLQVNTVDQHIKDDTAILVEVLDRTEVQNLSVRTVPIGFVFPFEDIIQGGFTASSVHKDAVFPFSISDIFTDITSVKLRLVTKNLYVLAGTGLDNQWGSAIHASDYWFSVQFSTNYPSDLTLSIDGVDATTALGGPWNPSAGNSPVDVTLDITPYITNAPGGLYQNHQITVSAGAKPGDAVIPSTPAHNSYPAGDVSHGIVQAFFIVFGNVRGLF